MPEALVVLGVCGGIEEKGRDVVRLGDVVVPTYLHYAEFVKVVPEGRLRRYSPYDHPSVSLRHVFVEAARVEETWRQTEVKPPVSGEPPEIVYGSLVASEKILSDPNSEEQRQVVADYPEAIALDMESFGAAKALHLARARVGYNPRFLVIRGVSDLIYANAEEMPKNHDNAEERKIWKGYAAANAAALALDVARRFLGAADDREDQRSREREGE